MFDFFLSHTHTHFSHSGKEKTGRAGVSRVGPRENRKLGAGLKTNCNKVWLCHKSVEIGPGMLDYLLRSAPTYRERFVTSKKSKIVVGTFFLPSLSFGWFPRGFGDFCPSSFDVELFLIFFGRIVSRVEGLSVLKWNDLQVIPFCCVVLGLLFLPLVFAAE